VFSRTLLFATIPKACGFEAATHFPSILLGGSLIPIVVIGMGMVLPWLNTYKAGIHERNGFSGFPFPAFAGTSFTPAKYVFSLLLVLIVPI